MAQTAKRSNRAGWPPPRTPPGGARRSCATCGASATWPRTACSPTSATCGSSSTGSAAGGSQGLAISELSDYPAWLTAQELAPASISRHVVSLKVFFRYLQLEGVLTDNQAELLGTQKLWQRVPTVLSRSEIDVAAHGAQAAAALVAARSGDARTAVRDRLPRFGAVDPAAARRAPGRALLPVPRQGRQAARRAARAARRWRRSRRTWSTSGRSSPHAARRRRSSCCSRRAAAGCGASGFGS